MRLDEVDQIAARVFEIDCRDGARALRRAAKADATRGESRDAGLDICRDQCRCGDPGGEERPLVLNDDAQNFSCMMSSCESSYGRSGFSVLGA